MADPQVLHAQLQSILDMANRTFSADQAQLLAREIQKTLSNSVAGSSNPRKRKSSCCDGTNCGPPPSPMKPRPQASEGEISVERSGQFKCEACGHWVALVDETGFTLAPWVAHLPVCGQLKRTLTSAKKHAVGTSERLARKDISSTQSSTSSGSRPVARTEGPSTPSPTPSPSPSIEGNTSLQFKMSMQPPSDAHDHPTNAPTILAESEGVSALKAPPQTTDTDQLSPASPLAHGGRVGDYSAHTAIAGGFQATFETPISFEPFPPKQRRPNRTEAERIEEFRADSHVAEVEPYRVLCAVCNKWIKLRKNSRYCSIPWNCHKASCDRMNGSISGAPSQPSSISTSSLRHIIPYSHPLSYTGQVSTSIHAPAPSEQPVPNPSLAHPSLTVNIHPPRVHPSLPPRNAHPSLHPHASMPPPSPAWTDSSIAASGSRIPNSTVKVPRRARLADAEQRRAALQADPNTEIVEPDRIMCGLCKKWVKLRPNSSYCSAPWQSHIQRCIARRGREKASKVTSELDTQVPASDTSVTGGDDIIPHVDLNKPKGSYYRKDYEKSTNPRSNDGEVRASYYKAPLSAPALAPQVSAMSGLPLRRGRPLKNKAPEPKPNHTADNSDSDISYESEEE